MSSGEGVDIDLYADDIEQDFNAEEFAGDGVDLYDDVIANSSGPRGELEDGGETTSASPTPSSNNVSKANSIGEGREGRDGITPLRKHQAYVGGLTWWTSDKNMQDVLSEIGVNDFIEVKFYENRANGQSKGYCVLTVGSEASLRAIHEKLPKKEIHGQVPVVTPPTKQALNQFEAQSKTRPAQGTGTNQGGNMNMMGPRGPMGPMPGQPMGMGMGFGPRMMMGPMRGGPRMPPGMPPRNMGPPNNQGGPPPGYNSPQRPPPGMGPGGPQNMPPGPHGPPQRPPMQDPYFQGGGPMGPQGMPPRGPMPGPGMDPRGPPPRGEWNRPPMNSYPPHGQAPPPSGPMQGPPARGPPQVAPPMIPGPQPGAPAPHMNPAFFNQPGPQGPPQGGPPPNYGGAPPGSRPSGSYPPSMDHRDAPPQINMSEAEFEEVMSRNRTVSSSAISRAVADAATGEFASAIETLVTAISLIKQSKVAHDDRCKILVSSLQDTLHGIESKGYGRREERSRSRERDRHSRRSRRERSRSRERDYRDRSRDRYYDFPRERSRSREREYRDRTREESGATTNRYYEERERYQREGGRSERERRGDPERSREREREPEVHRATRH